MIRKITNLIMLLLITIPVPLMTDVLLTNLSWSNGNDNILDDSLTQNEELSSQIKQNHLIANIPQRRLIDRTEWRPEFRAK